MKEMEIGDGVLFYHSNAKRRIAGVLGSVASPTPISPSSTRSPSTTTRAPARKSRGGTWWTSSSWPASPKRSASGPANAARTRRHVAAEAGPAPLGPAGDARGVAFILEFGAFRTPSSNRGRTAPPGTLAAPLTEVSMLHRLLGFALLTALAAPAAAQELGAGTTAFRRRYPGSRTKRSPSGSTSTSSPNSGTASSRPRGWWPNISASSASTRSARGSPTPVSWAS